MKCNLFCLACLSLAALVGIFLGVDPNNPRVKGYENLFWIIIGIGLIPAAIQLTCEECRAFRSWFGQLRRPKVKGRPAVEK